MWVRRAFPIAMMAVGLTGCYDIQDLPGGSFGEAYALNEAGEVVGYGTTSTNQAFLWTSAGPVALPLLPGTGSCAANGINDSGLIAGSCLVPGGNAFVAVTWSRATRQVTRLDLPLGWLSSQALAVSQDGFVAGTYAERVGNLVR